MSTRRAGALVAMAVLSAGAIPAAALEGASTADGHAVPPQPRRAYVATSHTVVLEHKRFLPGRVSIRRNESVMWLWRDGVLHNVIGHGFQSRTMTRGSFTVRFTHSGTYDYTCTVHPHMDGTVIVR